MSAALHAQIKLSRALNGDLYHLMNNRSSEWGLVNGQLVRFSGDKIVKFERMTFRLDDPRLAAKEKRRRATLVAGRH